MADGIKLVLQSAELIAPPVESKDVSSSKDANSSKDDLETESDSDCVQNYQSDHDCVQGPADSPPQRHTADVITVEGVRYGRVPIGYTALCSGLNDTCTNYARNGSVCRQCNIVKNATIFTAKTGRRYRQYRTYRRRLCIGDDNKCTTSAYIARLCKFHLRKIGCDPDAISLRVSKAPTLDGPRETVQCASERRGEVTSGTTSVDTTSASGLDYVRSFPLEPTVTTTFCAGRNSMCTCTAVVGTQCEDCDIAKKADLYMSKTGRRYRKYKSGARRIVCIGDNNRCKSVTHKRDLCRQHFNLQYGIVDKRRRTE